MVLLMLATLALQQTAMRTVSARDTTVVVQGLLVKAPPASGGGWLMALPTPLGFREFSVGELELVGDTARWYGFNGHYVEARGKLAATPTSGPRPRGVLQINSVKEVDPAGTVRRTVSESWAHRVAVVLWVLPQKFSWRTETGQPTGVGPALVYTLNNHSESDVSMLFETKEFICFSVEPQDGGAPPWRYARTLEQPQDRQRVTLPKFIREVARLPESAAPTPGKYVVRAGLCGFKEYELETELQVVR
jgi:hypothetical protein